MSARAVRKHVTQTAAVEEAAVRFGAAQHALAKAARAMADVLENQDAARYPGVWRDLQAALKRSEAATVAYVAVCADTE